MFVSILALLSGWFLIVRYLYGGTKLLCTTNKILIALSCGGAVVVIIGIVCVILGYEDYLMFIVFGSPASIPFIHMFLIWIPKNNANKSLQPTANAPAELNRYAFKEKIMTDGAPKLIAIDHDDYHAEHIGRTQDGKQFFLTTPFEPAIAGKSGSEYVALFLFDENGKFLDAKIDDFGSRGTFNDEERRYLYLKRLEELGDVTFCRIEVEPFSVERFGTNFGLIPREPEDNEDIWAVELLPGNYMAFFEPWDSGDYDT